MYYDILMRFYQYLKERFPLKDFIPLSVVFAITAGVCVQVCIYRDVKNILSAFLGFLAFLLFLFRLRLFDEFKDFEHDRRYYPSRPVPRGLITLKELKAIILFILSVEILLAVSRGRSSIMLFSLAFVYSLLMFQEFFVREWLRKHFTAYIISHEMLIFPLFFYIFTLNGLKIQHIGQIFFWLLALFLGCQIFLLEVARKIRPAELEISSRDTYTARYGIGGASILIICLGVIVVFLMNYVEKIAPREIPFLNYIPLLVLLGSAFKIFQFYRHPGAAYAKQILNISIAFVMTVDVVIVVQLLL